MPQRGNMIESAARQTHMLCDAVRRSYLQPLTPLYSLYACDKPLARQCASGEHHKAVQVCQLWRLALGGKLAHALQKYAAAVEKYEYTQHVQV
jgi:hypothetical protein